MTSAEDRCAFTDLWLSLKPDLPDPGKVIRIQDCDERAITLLLKTLFVVCKGVLEDRQRLRSQVEAADRPADCRQHHHQSHPSAAGSASDIDHKGTSTKENVNPTAAAILDDLPLDVSMIAGTPPSARSPSRPYCYVPETTPVSSVRRPQKPPSISEAGQQPSKGGAFPAQAKTELSREIGGDKKPKVLVPETMEVSPVKGVRRKRPVLETQPAAAEDRSLSKSGSVPNPECLINGPNVSGVSHQQTASGVQPGSDGAAQQETSPERRARRLEMASSPVLPGRSPALRPRRGRRPDRSTNSATSTAIATSTTSATTVDTSATAVSTTTVDTSATAASATRVAASKAPTSTERALSDRGQRGEVGVPPDLGSPLLFPQGPRTSNPAGNLVKRMADVDLGCKSSTGPPSPAQKACPVKMAFEESQDFIPGRDESIPPRKSRSSRVNKLTTAKRHRDGSSSPKRQRGETVSKLAARSSSKRERREIVSKSAARSKVSERSDHDLAESTFYAGFSETTFVPPLPPESGSDNVKSPPKRLSSLKYPPGDDATTSPLLLSEKPVAFNMAGTSKGSVSGRAGLASDRRLDAGDRSAVGGAGAGDTANAAELKHAPQITPDDGAESLFFALEMEAEKPLHDRGPIRKKAERRRLPGWSCDVCKKWYEGCGLTDSQLRQHMDRCSRHRAQAPPVPQTPPNFWDPTHFPAPAPTQWD